MSQLQDLALHPQLFKALNKLGFIEATAVQAEAIPLALEGKDIMVSARTGSGKTAAFILPMLHKMLTTSAPDSGTRALILLPTRELALQTEKTFNKLAAFTPITCGLIIGGEAFKHQVATIRKNPEVIIATPGRLVEHIEKGTPDLAQLEILVLDEADRMLDMGFSEDMNTISTACGEAKQNMLFSATLQHKSLGRIQKIFRQPVSVEVDSHREGQEHIKQQRVLADDIKHKELLVAALIEQEQAKRVFIFCNTRAQCQQLGNLLKYKKLRVGFIHGEISQSDRKQVMSQFRDGKLEVLVATDVAARGLDIADIDLVINFSVAQSGDDHVHRIGRTGRAGKEGLAITLVSPLEWNQMSSIERYLKVRLEPRKVKGLEASYSGPKKVKASGKAAGVKKTDATKTKTKSKATKPAKKKPVKKANKSSAKPATKSTAEAKTIGHGFSAVRKRK